ncbi:hypothetical protein [Planktothricoides sp. SR001]|uniref:hypothetical protein n=1 Tax=Planktothricoides sp. SR001 TaxID=1705388 RepID=UPI0012E0CCAA|nr:hypothetical protein [Planktothricoides sp. SR001]
MVRCDISLDYSIQNRNGEVRNRVSSDYFCHQLQKPGFFKKPGFLVGSINLRNPVSHPRDKKPGFLSQPLPTQRPLHRNPVSNLSRFLTSSTSAFQETEFL